jgi:cytochrome c nitrite reductase small subunit
MNRQYDGWAKASHHGVAGCVDCHLPHTFPEKYIAKAENGWHHSEAFTTQHFAEPIAMKARAREILQANCVDCHESLTEHIAGGARGKLDELPCIHCHANVGHGEHAGLGGPLRYPELTTKETSR